MSQPVECPSCGAKLRIPDKLLNKTIKCPKCRHRFFVESDDQFEVVEDEEILVEDAEDEEEDDRPRRRGRPRELSWIDMTFRDMGRAGLVFLAVFVWLPALVFADIGVSSCRHPRAQENARFLLKWCIGIFLFFFMIGIFLVMLAVLTGPPLPRPVFVPPR